MTSKIDITKLNTNYPVPGVDNSTAGFRENFSIISDNLGFAKQEIDDLQTNTAKTNQNAEFFGNRIINAEKHQSTKSFYDLGNIDTDETISFSNGHYQTITVDNDITLTLDNWPSEEKYAKITVSLLNAGTEQLIEWITLKDNNPGIIKKNTGHSFLLSDSTKITLDSFPDPFIVDSETDPVVVEFWTTDRGDTVYANYLGKFS